MRRERERTGTKNIKGVRGQLKNENENWLRYEGNKSEEGTVGYKKKSEGERSEGASKPLKHCPHTNIHRPTYIDC